ncbi:uncharacterized protein LOC117187479 [Drosophila miranda]|uniref:uncharacterized protein LOC117187479 n=1 Tax=Drosophila miranda TaxID=7229 RepID=UPI00143FAD1A|nr:uncharacterized protein LOC117187479 [Drosophila miranda]
MVLAVRSKMPTAMVLTTSSQLPFSRHTQYIPPETSPSIWPMLALIVLQITVDPPESDNDVNASGHNPDHDSTDPPAPLPLFRSRQRAPRVGQRGYYHLVIPGPQLGTHTSFPLL